MFSFTVKPYKKKDGTMTNVILATGDNVDSTYPYREQMKQYGALWIKSLNTWGWYGSPDSEKMNAIINGKVKPAIEFLLSKEKAPSDNGQRTVMSVLDELLNSLSTEDTESEKQAANNVYMSTNEIRQKIQEFKEKLVSTVNSDEFKRLMMPIINARRAQGYQYSLKNTILIWIQDPQARLVKSKRKWAAFNREPKENAPRIAMFVPIGGDKEFKGRDARKQATDKWLKERGFSSVKELTLGEKEILKGYLDQTCGEVMFKLAFCFYDQRFTQTIAGKEDLLGDTDTSKIPWYNDSGRETQAVKEKIYALLKVVSESGVNVSKQKNLSGALGVSKGGNIDVLEDAKMNSNFLMTLTHEFAHELLHQTYLKNSGSEWGQFYAGREEGRKYVEQQAELTAWIVCQFYGYDIREAINYAGIWGIDAKNAVKAFDSVAKAADTIINAVNEKIRQERGETMKEGKEYLKEVNFTGRDVAKMVGAEDLYLQGIQEFEELERMQEEARKSFSEMVGKINESERKRKREVFD